MICAKFGIGQKVRHSLLGYLGVIIDVDPEYSLNEPLIEEILKNNNIKSSPWYHVIMEDDKGKTMHTYLAESQISLVLSNSHYEQSCSLNMFSDSIRTQLKTPKLCH